MTDRDFTKLLGEQLLNAKGFYDYGIRRGLTTPEEMRLTIAGRRDVSKAMLDNGMSQREVAKLLGVSRKTVQNDVATFSPRNGENVATRALLAQSDQNDWRTPRKFLEAARKVLGAIDLDPASGPEANETVRATHFYTENDNGLERPWKGRVWLNPPYGGEARLFVERAVREYQVGNVTAACLLVNSHPTETQWFQALLDYPVCFVAGRIDFGGPSREVSSNSTHGSAIFYLGDKQALFAETFSPFGKMKP